MKLLTDKITIDELKAMSEKMFEGIVKAVVDIEKECIVVDAAMHADQEFFLLENGSQQEHLWGINLVPDKPLESEDFVVFDSMINLRPGWGNRSRVVENPQIREKIKKIVRTWVKA